VRFSFLERLGIQVAAISEKADGDCGEGVAGEAFCAELGVDYAAVIRGRQVHGDHVAAVGEGERGLCLWNTDGLVTDVPGLPLAVTVADCVPVYVFDTCRRVAGVVHAGREGTRQGIAAQAVRLMAERFSCRAGDIHAVIGPSAGPCCYEVTDVMAGEFRTLGLPTEGRRLDLWESNAGQLVKAGVPRDQIEVTGICTICGDRFFSYRRGNEGKRNLALICL